MPSHGRWCEKKRYWTKEEREKRAEVDPEWFEVVDAGCHRQALMKYFERTMQTIVRRKIHLLPVAAATVRLVGRK
jgi:hypothetical protein